MEEIKKKSRKVSNNQLLINKFIIPNITIDKYFYGREGKCAKRLIADYGLDFLLWVPLPDNKRVGSLLWFLDNGGQNYLKAYLLEFRVQLTDLSVKKEEIKLLPTKIGEDVIINRKPNTLKEFLNLYKYK